MDYAPACAGGTHEGARRNHCETIERSPEFPTLVEQGLDGFDIVLYGMLAPTGTPRPIIEKLHAVFVEFAAMPDIKERLSGIGAEPGTMSLAEFGAMIKRDIARWKKVAQEAGIRL